MSEVTHSVTKVRSLKNRLALISDNSMKKNITTIMVACQFHFFGLSVVT